MEKTSWYDLFFRSEDVQVPGWRPNITEWDKLSVDDAKFFFAQAEKLLDDTIKNYDATTTKSLSMLTILNGMIVAQVAYFFVQFDPEGVFSAKLTTIFIATIYLFNSVFHILKNILPNSYKVMGSPPDKLYVKDFYENKYESLLRTVLIYRSETVSYNTRIYFNMEVNRRRLDQFKAAAIKTIIYPLFCMVVYFVVLGVGLLVSGSG